MQKIIANILSVEPNAVSIKATTSEKMGFVGREEGIAAYATVLLMAIQ
jgi:2-C-methyl-D-erythritol 2,4-cyclodiphosphate synthase